VGRNETVASLSDEDLLKRLFYQGRGPDERLMRAAQVCALLYSFDGEILEGENAELPQLAALAGITADELFGYVAVLKDRDLIQQRGAWRALLPHTIANNIAKLALKMFPIQKIEAAMNTERLQKSFARRLGYLHDSKEARNLVTRWLDPGGRLASIGKYDEIKRQMFQLVAPVAPDATLACLERMIGTDSAAIQIDSWQYADAARLLRSIAYEPEFFVRCVNLLLVLAEAESRKGCHPHQSIASILESLFQIRYSGTCASVEMRVQVVDRLLRSDSAVHREIGVKALEELLRTRDFHANHSFEFGARTRDYGYWPKGDDVFKWFRAVLQIVQPLACSDHSHASQIRSVFARSFKGLWSVGGVRNELEQIARGLSTYGWQEGWIAIRKALRKHGSKMPAEDRQRLEALEVLLHPSELVSRTRAVVLTDAWGPLDYADIDQPENEEVGGMMVRHERAMKTAQELGEEVALDNAAFQTLLPDLPRGGSGPRPAAFGIGLATPAGDRIARWNALADAVRQTAERERNYGVLNGFMAGLHNAEPSLCDSLLDALMGDPVLGQWLPVLQTCVPIDDAGAKRLRRMLDADVAPVERYRHLAGGRYLDAMNADDFKLLIDAIRNKPSGFAVACDVLSMRLHSEKDKQRKVPELAEAGRALLEGIVFEKADNMQDYRLTQIAKSSLGDEAGAATVAAVCRKLRSAVESHEIYRFDGDKFIPALFETQSIAALDGLFGGDATSAKPGYQIINEISLNHDNPLDSVSDDTLIAWCDREPALRYPMMSCLISYSRDAVDGGQEWTPLALRMLERAPDANVVLSNFVERFSPVMCEGSRATYVEQRSRLLEGLDDRFGPALISLQEKRAELQAEVNHLRTWEAKRDRDRDESFE
jgi:hypothetical protein